MPPLPPEECAQCGATIPRHARACPECGADERTGWRESSLYDGLELPDGAYADEDAPRPPPARRGNGIAWYWWCIGVGVLVLFGLAAFGLR